MPSNNSLISYHPSAAPEHGQAGASTVTQQPEPVHTQPTSERWESTQTPQKLHRRDLVPGHGSETLTLTLILTLTLTLTLSLSLSLSLSLVLSLTLVSELSFCWGV